MTAKRRWKWFMVSLSLVWAITQLSGVTMGCKCEEELPPAKPRPIIEIEPSNWTLGSKLIPGQIAYVKFTIRNKKEGSEPLEVKSIKLRADSSPLYSLVTEACPKQFEHTKDKKCADSDCVIYDHNGDIICAQLPVSLPAQLPYEHKGISFVIAFKPGTSGEVPSATLEIESNTENDKGEEFVATRVILRAMGGEAIIDVTGYKMVATGPKELSMSFSRVTKNETKEEAFTVSNIGDADLIFKIKWEIEDPQAQFQIVDESGQPALDKEETLLPMNRSPANAKNLKARYTPKDCGSHEARLTVTSNAIYKKLDDEGNRISSDKIYIRLRGSSPTGAELEPVSLFFENVKPGQEMIKTFEVRLGAMGLCDLKVYGLRIDAIQGQTAPKHFRLGKMRKGGQEVATPSKEQPIIVGKGEALAVEVIYAPTAQGGESGVIILDSNDPDLDPDQNGVLNISGGTEVNLAPQASFTFRCAAENSQSCKKGDDLGGAMFMSGERRVEVELDSSKSYDREGKIVGYKRVVVRKPTGSLTSLSATDAEKANPIIVIDGAGLYRLQLTVIDDAQQTSTISNDLNVQP
jgi:hypothetical protein